MKEALNYLPFMIPIGTALTGGIITFVVSVLSKEQKTSEFRQAWIDDLRNRISELISEIDTLRIHLDVRLENGKSEEEVLNFYYGTLETTTRIYAIFLKIKLQLNPKEHQKLLGYLSELKKCFNKKEMSDASFEELKESMIIECGSILKKEWKRVKRGEPVFIVTKWVSLSVFIFAIASLGYYLINRYL